MDNSEKDYINFDKLREYVGIANESLFLKYLKEVYKDLADRSESSKKKGITKITFLDYIKLPIFISEKVFCSFDQDRDGFLNPKDFIYGMKKLYNGSFEETIQIIFELLDFNSDGIIEKDDVKIMLSYLPLRTDKSPIEYKYQMDSLDEIDEILNLTFGEKTGLKMEEFMEVVEKKKSDVFLQILCFLYQKKPFTEENINVLKDSKKKAPVDFKLATPQLKFNMMVSPTEGKLLPSPNKRSSLSPASCFLQVNALKTKFELNPKSPLGNTITCEVSGLTGMVRFHNENIPKNESDYDENSNINDIIKNSQNFFMSPSTFLREKRGGKVDDRLKNFTLENNLKEINEKDKENIEGNNPSNNENIEFSNNIKNNNQEKEVPKNNKDVFFTPQKKVVKEEPEVLYEDYIYKLSENIKLKKYFLVLIGKDIFYYKNNKKEEMLGMHNLSGCFVTENGTKVFNGKPYYSFTLVFPSRSRNYYCASKEICDNFINNLKKAFGYLNFFDYYEMLDQIGEGIFGVVKLGIYKKTGEKVAIKIIKKNSAKQNDIELVRTEIDIMKLCHHPNIVRLLDHFENAEYIFIVMEYIAGGDLAEYMKKNKNNITENRASQIIYQIALGLKYLHQYGIIHRDLKPENIMLTEQNDNGMIKIMDFGLSKILGAKEKSVEGFGTLTFVAPEVLVRTPYNKEIDIWSLGVILYLMLSGTLPFDDEDDNEEVIAKLTVYSDVKFPSKLWSKRSPLVIDLIKKCLTKDPVQRIKIDEILNNSWIKQYIS